MLEGKDTGTGPEAATGPIQGREEVKPGTGARADSRKRAGSGADGSRERETVKPHNRENREPGSCKNRYALCTAF